MVAIVSLAQHKGVPWQPERAEQFSTQLLHVAPFMNFQIVATQERIEWQLLNLDEGDDELVIRAVKASYPEVQVEDAELGLEWSRERRPHFRYMSKYQAFDNCPFLAPIKYASDIKRGESDPLAGAVGAMHNLRPNERITYSVFVWGTPSKDVYEQGKKFLYQPVYTDGWSVLFPREHEPRYVHEDQHAMEEKQGQSLYRTLVVIQIDTPSQNRIAELLAVDSQMVLFDKERLNGLRRYSEPIHPIQITDDATDIDQSVYGLYRRMYNDGHLREVKAQRKRLGLILEPREIAALWHLPHTGFLTPTIQWATKPKPELSAEAAAVQDGIFLGYSTHRGQTRPVYWQHKERSTHMLVVGRSGTGKSTFAHSLITQDICDGKGVIVLDPHGNNTEGLVERILCNSIPKSRLQDVVLLDFADPEYPPPLNLLAATRGQASQATAGEIVSIMERVYDDMDSTRWSNTLKNALFTLWQDDQATLLDVQRLFTNDAYRKGLVAKIGIENIAVLQFWQTYESMTNQQRAQLREPVERRIQAFITNPVLLPILCHPQTTDFAQLIAENKIVLISLGLDPDLVPEAEQNFLAMLMIAAIEKSAYARQTNKLFPVYIDEAQRFVTTSLATVFAQLRKSGLSFTLVNQFLKQYTEEIREAVLGNVGAMITFQCSETDARALDVYLKPEFTVEDLVKLDKYTAAAWLRSSGKNQPAFFLEPARMTQPVEPEWSEQGETIIRAQSRETYTPLSKAAIFEWLRNRYMPPPPSSDDNSKPKSPDSGLYDT